MFEVNLCLDRGRYHVKSSGYSCKASIVSDKDIFLEYIHICCS